MLTHWGGAVKGRHGVNCGGAFPQPQGLPPLVTCETVAAAASHGSRREAVVVRWGPGAHTIRRINPRHARQGTQLTRKFRMQAIKAVDYARQLGITRQSIYKRVRSGSLKAFWVQGVLYVQLPAQPARRRNAASSRSRADVEAVTRD